MKLLLIGDLHGRIPKLKFREFDAFILVGDIADDKEIGKLTKSWFEYIKTTDNPDSLGIFMKKRVGKKAVAEMEKRSLLGGNKVLRHLDKFNKPIYMVAGNWDQSYGKSRIKNEDKSQFHTYKSYFDGLLGDKINPILTAGTKNIINCMYKTKKFKGTLFYGYGLSNSPEEIRIKSKKRSKTQLRKIKSLQNASNKIFLKLKNNYKNKESLPTIFITHNIPNNTALDIIKNKKSYAYKKHLGSTVARQFVDKFQPMLCVGGHIHENRGKCKIRKTIVINPGYGENAQVLVDIDEIKGKVRSVKF